MKKIHDRHILIFLVVLISSAVLFDSAQAFTPKEAISVIKGGLSNPFGGKITVKTFEICALPAPPPIFFIPMPFIYLEVGPPKPAKLYYIYGYSRSYDRNRKEVTAWALGTYLVAADDLFRKVCLNGFALPEADGIIQKIGTSCKQGESSC